MGEDKKNINKRACILGYPVDLVNMENAIDFAEELIKSGSNAHVITINPEMIIQAQKNSELSETLKNAELIIPDGTGIIKALRRLKIKNISQIPGIEFSENLIKKCAENGYSVAFLGASKDTVETAAKEMKKKYPDLNVVFVHDGFFDEAEEAKLAETLKQVNPQVLFVALGVPKQEFWIARHKNELNSTVMIGVGGSFDVWAKKVKRAPVIFRKLSLEWFYRLITQPSRFNRMFPTLPLFMLKVMFDNVTTRKEY